MKKLTPSLLWLFIGCKALSGTGGLSGYETSIDIARLHMEAGEHYQAKKMTQAILDEDPESKEALVLMGEIINQEIALHHETFDEVKAPEEFSSPEQEGQIKTWLERSEAFFSLGQLDRAQAAAEKVFLYDPTNLQASQLVDKIRKENIRQGKHGLSVRQAMARDELGVRVERYRKNARELIEEEKWGAAKHTVQKILLLSPEDPEGLSLQKTILLHQSQAVA